MLFLYPYTCLIGIIAVCSSHGWVFDVTIKQDLVTKLQMIIKNKQYKKNKSLDFIRSYEERFSQKIINVFYLRLFRGFVNDN